MECYLKAPEHARSVILLGAWTSPRLQSAIMRSSTWVWRTATACLSTICAVTLLAQTKEPAIKRSALVKLAEPWPDAEALHARRDEAQTRPLFAGSDAV